MLSALIFLQFSPISKPILQLHTFNIYPQTLWPQGNSKGRKYLIYTWKCVYTYIHVCIILGFCCEIQSFYLYFSLNTCTSTQKCALECILQFRFTCILTQKLYFSIFRKLYGERSDEKQACDCIIHLVINEFIVIFFCIHLHLQCLLRLQSDIVWLLSNFLFVVLLAFQELQKVVFGFL